MDEDRQLVLDYVLAMAGDHQDIDIAGYAATLATDELLRCRAPEVWEEVHAALRRDVDRFLVGKDPSPGIKLILDRFFKMREQK